MSVKKKNLTHFKRVVWHSMNRRCTIGHYSKLGIEVKVTREQFNAWCDTNRRKIEHLYSAGKTPSIDRKNPDGHYELSNMRIMERWKNVRGSRRNPIKSVIAVHLKSGRQMRFASLKAAAISVGGASSNISNCTSGKIPSAYGWKWSVHKD